MSTLQKRGPQPRAPSPTPTAFSQISNYRTDPAYARRDAPSGKAVPAVPALDPRIVARTHFEELSRYLAAYLAKASPNSRSSARQKLTRLTRQQFQELSTDVYDELVRRKKNSADNSIPFLPVRDDFHPKRNQARQKLATLPTSRFEDLSSDVYYELARRYPEFKDGTDAQVSSASTYEDSPSPEYSTSKSRSAAPNLNGRSNARPPDDRVAENPYAGASVSARRPGDRRPQPSDDYSSGRRSEEAYAASISSRRKQSQDTVMTGRKSEDRERAERDLYGRKSEDRERERPEREKYPRKSEDRERPERDMYGRAPSGSVSSDSTANQTAAVATAGIIVPTKSTIAEEEIEIPYGREQRESASTAVDTAESENMSPLGGLSGLTARLRDEETDGSGGGGGGRSGEDYFDKISFGRAGSAASSRSIPGDGSVSRMGNGSSAEDQETMRREYEYKIATMQSKISGLERDLSGAEDSKMKMRAGEDRVRQMEEELAGLRRRAEEQTSTMRSLQKELDDIRETRTRDREREARRAREDGEQLKALRDRCERLEEEQATNQGGADPAIVDQLRNNMQGLLVELSDLSRRNDELLSGKDSDLVVIRDLDGQLKEYKRKYEQAKTELRSVKATSQLFLQAPKQLDDQLPVSPDGGILDVHVTAFLSAIDSLLTAGRTSTPTKVLTPMKAVVNAVASITDDIQAFERRPSRDRSDVDLDALQALRERADATLSNLVTATRTHATSSGMSPVSLLDAAASHVSATITEIGKTLCIRKASKGEQDQFIHSSGGMSATNGFAPTLRSVEETSHSRNTSTTSSRRGGGGDAMSPPTRSPASRFARTPAQPQSQPSTSPSDPRRRPSSDQSSSGASSPPPIFDAPPAGGRGAASDDSIPADGPEDAWSELKPYLEAQTESIVYAIQSVLSGVRSPTPSPTLNENLTQIITIVSSIVAVCQDNVPTASAQQGNEILRELSEHANKLSEVQALPEVTKESRQVMAKSSFAVANAMKGLMKL